MNGKSAIGMVTAVGLGILILISLGERRNTDPASQKNANGSTIIPSSTTPHESTEADTTPKEFDGAPCTSDCSGHEAGYSWAEEHGIDDESDCDQAEQTSNSPSFGEGCRAFVRGDSPEEDNDGDGDDSED